MPVIPSQRSELTVIPSERSESRDLHLVRRVATVCLLVATACRTDDLVVRTDAGPVRGGAESRGDTAVRRFSRVPYAAPPTGDLRWRPPRPPERWSDTYDATRPMPACPQDLASQTWYIREVGKSIGAPASRYGEGVAVSEDCLYVSIWTPAAARERHPVMVWLHGGSNLHGWGGDPFFDGSALARRGAVVVSINYRLGVLGFFAHPALAVESERGVSGNYGLLDQLAALAWVQHNIGAFGGDSSRVTLFGQSAGATDAACLLSSPLAQGLVQRAILQSGDCLASWLDARRTSGRVTPADDAGMRFARALTSAEDDAAIAALRRLAPDSLRAAAESLSVSFDPVVDGWVLPDQPAARAQRGELLRVPVIVGSNADEASSLVPPRFPPSAAVYRRVLASEFGAKADSAFALYPADDSTARRAAVALRSDAWMSEPARATAALFARAGAPAFLYRLARGADVARRDAVFGAFHGAELPFVFGTNPERWPYVDAAAEVGRLVRDYWVAFAATGDPNGAGRPEWPRFSSEAPSLLELDRAPRVRSARDARLDWLERARVVQSDR
jgi:para-nitrobenzyl esterase